MLGKRLQVINYQANQPQKLFGNLLVPQTTYANYESEKAKVPDIVRQKLATHHNINLHFLVTSERPIHYKNQVVMAGEGNLTGVLTDTETLLTKKKIIIRNENDSYLPKVVDLEYLVVIGKVISWLYYLRINRSFTRVFKRSCGRLIQRAIPEMMQHWAKGAYHAGIHNRSNRSSPLHRPL